MVRDDPQALRQQRHQQRSRDLLRARKAKLSQTLARPLRLIVGRRHALESSAPSSAFDLAGSGVILNEVKDLRLTLMLQ